MVSEGFGLAISVLPFGQCRKTCSVREDGRDWADGIGGMAAGDSLGGAGGIEGGARDIGTAMMDLNSRRPREPPTRTSRHVRKWELGYGGDVTRDGCTAKCATETISRMAPRIRRANICVTVNGDSVPSCQASHNRGRFYIRVKEMMCIYLKIFVF